MSRPLRLQRRSGRQAKKRHLRRLLLRHDLEPDLCQSFHEGFPGRPRALGEAQQREHEEEVPTVAKVFAVPSQHLAPASGRRDAVDHHAEVRALFDSGKDPAGKRSSVTSGLVVFQRSESCAGIRQSCFFG